MFPLLKVIFYSKTVFGCVVITAQLVKINIAGNQTCLPMLIKSIFGTAAESIAVTVFVMAVGRTELGFIHIFADTGRSLQRESVFGVNRQISQNIQTVIVIRCPYIAGVAVIFGARALVRKQFG